MISSKSGYISAVGVAGCVVKTISEREWRMNTREEGYAIEQQKLEVWEYLNSYYAEHKEQPEIVLEIMREIRTQRDNEYTITNARRMVFEEALQGIYKIIAERELNKWIDDNEADDYHNKDAVHQLYIFLGRQRMMQRATVDNYMKDE